MSQKKRQKRRPDPRESTFIELMAHGRTNATQAYIDAGYSPRGAKQSVHNKLTDSDLCDKILKRKEELARKREARLSSKEDLLLWLDEAIYSRQDEIDQGGRHVQRIRETSFGDGGVSKTVDYVSRMDAAKTLASLRGWAAPAQVNVVHSELQDLVERVAEGEVVSPGEPGLALPESGGRDSGES